MESWSYISRGEEDLVHNESVSATNGNGGNENWVMSADVFMSSNTKNTQFAELDDYDERMAQTMAQTSSKPLIDLKLWRFPDNDNNNNNNNKDAQENANANPNFSSAESSMIPAKRIRARKSVNQIPYCQVYGCKKDLSNCKDYHKRHKVCEIHSKTAKVIVNGIDQRFCQQCSRFHLLSEFDDGKRSCRRRLAGHNERRRKPRIGMHSSRAGRLFQPYNGTRFDGSCFAFPSRHPSTNLPAQKHEINDPYTDVPQHGISYQICSNSETHSNNNNTPFLLHNNSNQEFDSQSLFPIEELTIFDSLQACQTLPSSSSSNCALSLLSFQSENPQNPQNILITACQTRLLQMRVSPQTSTSPISNAIGADETHMEPILISNGIGSDKYGINEFFPSSSVTESRVNNKNPSSNGDVSTIDLLRLSSQLEDRHRYMEVKQEDTFFGLRIT